MYYKKIIICVMIFFSISIIFGCKNKEKINDTDTVNSTVNLDKNINKELDNINRATSLVSDYLNSEVKNDLSYINNRDLESISYECLSERYILACIKIKGNSHRSLGWPILIDLNEEKCKSINLAPITYVDYIEFNDNKISFYLKSENNVDRFRDFPSVIEYDIEKDKEEKKKLFKSIKYYSDNVILGNGVNEIELKSIESNENKLLFKFKPNENTMFIGGYVDPKIKTGSIHNGDIFYIDLENVILDKSNEKIIEELKEEYYIMNVFSKTFEDEINNKHLVIYFKFNDMDEYNCEFINQHKGYQDFQITFQRK